MDTQNVRLKYTQAIEIVRKELKIPRNKSKMSVLNKLIRHLELEDKKLKRSEKNKVLIDYARNSNYFKYLANKALNRGF